MKNYREAAELLLILFFVTGCHVMKNNENPLSIPFNKEGHRGCRGLLPENTIPSMTRAIDLGVNTLEVDVVITKDQKVLISHEPYFHQDITTKPDGSYVSADEARKLNIYEMTYEQTQQYDVGMKPHPQFPKQEKIPAKKPLLSDLIDSVEAYAKLYNKPLPIYNIEVKSSAATDNKYHPEPKPYVKMVMDVVEEKKLGKRAYLQSFDFRILRQLHQDYPHVSSAVLVGNSEKRSLNEQLEDLGYTPNIYSPHYSMVSKSLLEECHNRKMKLIPWTVNDKPAIDSLIALGVDGIITDYPNLF